MLHMNQSHIHVMEISRTLSMLEIEKHCILIVSITFDLIYSMISTTLLDVTPMKYIIVIFFLFHYFALNFYAFHFMPQHIPLDA